VTSLDIVCLPALAPAELLGLQLHFLDAVASGESAPVLLLYQIQGKVISIGGYQLYDGPAARGEITAYRRLTGGRTINHGAGWLGCSLIAPSRTGLLEQRDAQLKPEQVMNRYVRGAMAGLRALGLDCFYPGRDAITCNRREVALCTFEENADRALLFELFIAAERGLDSLPLDTESFDPGGMLTCPMYTAGTATTLAQELGRAVGFTELTDRLTAGYGSAFGAIRRRDLTRAETAAADARRPALAQWLCSRKPEPALNLAARAAIQLGFMEAHLAASGERIERIAFNGDFIANSPGLAQFKHSLAGQRLDLMTLTAVVVRTYGDGSNFILGCGDPGNLASLILKAS